VVRAQAVRGQAAAEVRMALLPDRCTGLRLQGPERLTGDERRASYLLRCSDRFGNAVVVERAQVRSDGLSVEAQIAQPDGAVRVDVRTPFLTTPEDTVLLAQVAEASARLQVHLLPGSGVQAMVGPRLTLGWAYGSRWLGGAALDWALGFPLGRDTLLAGISLGALLSPAERVARDEQLRARRVITAPLLLQALYEKNLHPRLAVHGGLAAGPLFADPALERTGLGVNAELASALLVEAVGGAGVRAGDGLLSLDLRGGYALPLYQQTPLGSLSGLSLSLGYRFSF
jgi:hypothetical protein